MDETNDIENNIYQIFIYLFMNFINTAKNIHNNIDIIMKCYTVILLYYLYHDNLTFYKYIKLILILLGIIILIHFLDVF